MAVLWTFRAPSLCRHVHHELLRSVLLDVTPIIAVTVFHQRDYVERYSRYNRVLPPVFVIALPRRLELSCESIAAIRVHGDRPTRLDEPILINDRIGCRAR